MALKAHAAFEQHEVNDAVGGRALPRSFAPTIAVVGLANVLVMSAANLSCVARCDSDCVLYVVVPLWATSPSKLDSAVGREWTIGDVFLEIVVANVSVPFLDGCPGRDADDVFSSVVACLAVQAL